MAGPLPHRGCEGNTSFGAVEAAGDFSRPAALYSGAGAGPQGEGWAGEGPWKQLVDLRGLAVKWEQGRQEAGEVPVKGASFVVLFLNLGNLTCV